MENLGPKTTTSPLLEAHQNDTVIELGKNPAPTTQAELLNTNSWQWRPIVNVAVTGITSIAFAGGGSGYLCTARSYNCGPTGCSAEISTLKLISGAASIVLALLCAGLTGSRLASSSFR